MTRSALEDIAGTGRDRRGVERQLADWAATRSDPELRRSRLALLQRRRYGRRDLLQFDVVPQGSEAEALVVRGELLLHRSELASPVVRRRLGAYGLRARPVECLDGRVVRLVGGTPHGRIREIARDLRAHGVPVSAHHVTPMNPWVKGFAVPEPAPGPGHFPHRHRPASGTPVAVVDTGIAAAARPDGWLDGVARHDNVDPLDAVQGGGDGLLDVGAGHGTFVAGVLQQVAPDADIRMYRAMDSDGIGGEIRVACAMVRAAEEGASVVNLSLGSFSEDDQPPVALSVAMELLAERHPDVLVVAAAGNDGDTRPCWPAALPGVVAVAGLTTDHTASAWSNRGGWVTCSAVGEGLVSTFVEGRRRGADGAERSWSGADPWACWTGTSFAAPQVTGAVAAACAENPLLSPRQAFAALIAGAESVPGFGASLRFPTGA